LLSHSTPDQGSNDNKSNKKRIVVDSVTSFKKMMTGVDPKLYPKVFKGTMHDDFQPKGGEKFRYPKELTESREKTKKRSAKATETRNRKKRMRTEEGDANEGGDNLEIEEGDAGRVGGDNRVFDLTVTEDDESEDDEREEEQVINYSFTGSYGDRQGHITGQEHDALLVSGKMITASVVNGYLSVLIRSNVLNGVKRLDTTFYRSDCNENHFENYKQRRVYRENIDWEGKSDKIIFIPIFVGKNREAGHFSLLVLDRIIDEKGIFIYFDSMKSYEEDGAGDTFENIRKQIPQTDLWHPESKFTRANSQQQAHGTHDCGIFVCAFAASYMAQKHVIDMIMGEEDQSESMNAVEKVDVTLPIQTHKAVQAFGQNWRDVMAQTFRDGGTCDFGQDTVAGWLLKELKVELNNEDQDNDVT